MKLRIAGKPPLMAQAPTATRILQFFRNSRNTCTFSELHTPPSIKPMSQFVQCSISLMESGQIQRLPPTATCAHQYQEMTCDNQSNRQRRGCYSNFICHADDAPFRLPGMVEVSQSVGNRMRPGSLDQFLYDRKYAHNRHLITGAFNQNSAGWTNVRRLVRGIYIGVF